MLFGINFSFTRGPLSGVYASDFCCDFFRDAQLITSVEYVWTALGADIRTFSAMSLRTFVKPQYHLLFGW